MTSPIVGPVPPYSNPPIEPQFYQPRMYFISDISLGQTTTVTTSVDHDYVVNQEVRLIIPPSFGCRQLNQQTGFVISIPASDQVVLTMDSSRNVDPYIASSATTQAQIIAIGDVANGVINSTGRVLNGTYIPGSFINISPQ
jgi:hypothetical protein